MKKIISIILIVLLTFLAGCGSSSTQYVDKPEQTTSVLATATPVTSTEQAVSSSNSESNNTLELSFGTIPSFSGEPFVVVNNNKPFFTEADMTLEAFEEYSELDELGRCGVAFANICIEIMPTEKRGAIGMIKPSGWHTIRYDDLINGKYLYNRCHLIGYQLAGENANPENLITGTRYLNIDGMLSFEDLVDDYVEDTNNHVLYRVTPCFIGNELVARGVLMEGLSVEDNGKDVCFCVFAYNNQPGIEIDYATGDSWRASEKPAVTVEDTDGVELPDDTDVYGYIGNLKTHKFHSPTCSKLPKEDNQIFFETKEEAVENGYEPCGICKP